MICVYFQASAKWKNCEFFAEHPDGSRVKVNFILRIEFQDGKRRLEETDYGRGAAHLHACIFAETLKGMGMEHKVQAKVPDDPRLRGVILDSQCDYKSSGIPLREEESVFDDATGTVLLQHPAEAHRLHVRAFVPEEFHATK